MAAFEEQERASLSYWNAFGNEAFFRPIGSSWSPADTVRHLNKSTRPVAKALTMPKFALRLMFGKPARVSMTYDQLRDRYRDALAEGGRAGRFAPSERSESDAESWRRQIMGEFSAIHRDLRRGVARWRDGKLDRLQLPHPLLGKLTVREMLFFTLYHHRHHVAVVDRHLQESGVLTGTDR